MDERKNYVIVKDRFPRISEVLNDCVGTLCVKTYIDEPLSSILAKICGKITSMGTSCCYTFENTGTVTFSVSEDSIVTADVKVSTTGGNTLVVDEFGLFVPESLGEGTGTVTDFSAGNLSPLFTTGVATSTTTPALTFALNTQSANMVFAGPTSGGAAAPTFRALVSSDLVNLAAGSNTQVQYNNAGNFGASSQFTFNSGTNKVTMGGTLSVTGDADFQSAKLKITNYFGLPAIDIPLTSGGLTFLLDAIPVSNTNGNFLLISRGTAAKDYPFLFLSTDNANQASDYSGVIMGFDYFTSTHTIGKPLLITTSGNGSNNNGGDVIIRPGTFTNGLTTRRTGDWDVDLDPCQQGIVKIRNTTQWNVNVVSGSTTITNSFNTWVYTGTGGDTWSAPIVSGNTGNSWRIKNRGSGSITLNRQGSDNLYTSAATTTLTVNPGESYELIDDGTYILVL